MMYLQLDHRRIHFDISGSSEEDAPAVVLIHGLGQDLYIWNRLIPYLQDYRIIRLDLAGHGASSAPSDGIYQFPLFTDDLLRLLNHLHIQQATLFGYELGACIAMHFAGLHPDRVDRLVITAYPLFYPDAVRQKMLTQRLHEIRSQDPALFLRGRLPAITSRGDDDHLWDAYQKVSLYTYESIIQLLKSSDLSKDYHRNVKPVLYLTGELDDHYPPHLVYHALQIYPSPILVQVPGAKNLVHIDHPEYTAKRITAFIKTCSQPSSPLVHEASTHYARMIQMRHEQSINRYVLQIDVLNRFEARINGHVLAGNWKIRKAQELIIYLMLNRTAAREKLIELFWPHLSLENAQNILRVSINHLKKLIDKPFGTSFIKSRRDRIELSGQIESDLLHLLRDIHSFPSLQDAAEKELLARRIGQLLHPSLFEGYYDDWIIALRDELLNTAAPIIKWAANRCEAQGRLQDSILYYKFMLKMLPHEIELLKKIASLYDQLQLKALAQEWYGRYAKEMPPAD